MNPKHYHVQTPEGGFTFIGGETQPAENGDVWLTNPGGERVNPTTREETAKRIKDDLCASKAPMNGK